MEVMKRVLLNTWNSLLEGFWLLWGKLSVILPSMVVALLVLIIGSLFAIFCGSLITNLLKKCKVDQALDKTIFYPLSTLGIKINTSNLTGELVKWFMLFTVLIAAFDLAKMSRVIDFFTNALFYLPNVFVAIFIMLVGSMLSTLVVSLITILTKGEHEYLATTAKVSIYAFSAVFALSQLLTPILIYFSQFIRQLHLSQTKSDALFIGVIAFCVIAFGLGCRNIATGMLEKLYEKFQDTGNGKNLKKKLDEMVKISR